MGHNSESMVQQQCLKFRLVPADVEGGRNSSTLNTDDNALTCDDWWSWYYLVTIIWLICLVKRAPRSIMDAENNSLVADQSKLRRPFNDYNTLHLVLMKYWWEEIYHPHVTSSDQELLNKARLLHKTCQEPAGLPISCDIELDMRAMRGTVGVTRRVYDEVEIKRKEGFLMSAQLARHVSA
jgi:hypothetical protein